MKIQATEDWLPVYEALASPVRLKMIRLLSVKEMNVKELAQALGVSSAIMTMHVRKLEKSGIIHTEMKRAGGGNQKACTLVAKNIEIELPGYREFDRKCYETAVPVGHYTDFEIRPACGLATRTKIIGRFDDPRYFLEPERVNARIVWFGQGFLEYKIPNYLLRSQQPLELEISLEIGSEAPAVHPKWPSDISFHLNGLNLGTWTSPGNYGESRGEYTPDWWMPHLNQCGQLKLLRVNRSGTYLDGAKLSDITLDRLDYRRKQWEFRLSVPEAAAHVGGLTVYGKEFGSYNQDIRFKLYYTEYTE